MKRTLPTHHAALVLLSLSACVIADKDLGELASTSGAEETSGGSTGDASMTSNASMPETGGTETGEGEDCTPDAPMDCATDPDRDGFGYACDNAGDRFNPDQGDIDGDGIGDVADLCPTVASDLNSADSDRDGVGNECDSCRQALDQYNDADPSISVDAYLLVRSVPAQTDFDQDGIGDACDNCVQLANCESFGPDHPHEVGEPIAYDDDQACQRDDDRDLVGDACAGMQLPGAAGPIGLAPDDDFDQDGLSNMVDGCPRQPVARIDCSGDASACPSGATCEASSGTCNHVDSDADTVGDVCDTCPFTANGQQVTDGGAQEDDEDGDFVGAACEAGSEVYPSPLPMAFWSLAASGRCCSVALVEDEVSGDLSDAVSGAPLRDPDGLPIRIDCVEPGDPELRTCRALPQPVAQAPGILLPPPGCDGMIGEPVTLEDAGGDLGALWATRCELPVLDQDFDGLGDQGDLCPFAFDPENLPFIDEGGMVWQNDGKYCNGEYSLDAICGG